MALSKTWYSSMNLALADTSTATKAAHSSIWAFGAMLLGYQSGTNGAEGARPGSVAWTLEGSSDSTTAGIDSTDRLVFSGAFTDAKWVRNTAGSAHTWFVIKSPSGLLNGPWYICFDYIGPTNDQTCSMIVSRGVFSGGSTTARPTATNESVLTSFQFCSTTAGAGKAHLIGIDENGGFRWARSRNGTGYFDCFISLESLVEYHSGDGARSHLLMHFLDSSPGAMAMTQSPQMRGFCSDGTTGLTGTNQGIGEIVFRPAGIAMNSYTTTSAIDGTVDALPVCYVYNHTTNFRSIRGRYPDMWNVGNQVAVGSTFPGTGNPERVLVGAYMMACSVAPSL